jgi:hypothetical protein
MVCHASAVGTESLFKHAQVRAGLELTVLTALTLKTLASLDKQTVALTTGFRKSVARTHITFFSSI